MVYIGTLSGTSADAIDTAAFQFDNNIQYISGMSTPLSTTLREYIYTLQTENFSASDLAQLDNSLGQSFADSINHLIEKHHLNRNDIRAIGCHGQTILHQPKISAANPTPFSLQLGNAHIIAAQTYIPTISDFRRADIALGGQGAPLAAAFHQAFFSKPKTKRAIVNIGGIANVSLLDGEQLLAGFDCGPGNTLLDYLSQKHLKQAYDNHGDWAASADSYDKELFKQLKQHPYFAQQPPKSACTSNFNSYWLQQCVSQLSNKLNPATIQATLVELTSWSIEQAINSYLSDAEVFLCGGGANNDYLVHRLEWLLSCKTHETDSTLLTKQIQKEWVEAALFAWLAQQHINNKPIPLSMVTGAKADTISGVLYPALSRI